MEQALCCPGKPLDSILLFMRQYVTTPHKNMSSKENITLKNDHKLNMVLVANLVIILLNTFDLSSLVKNKIF